MFRLGRTCTPSFRKSAGAVRSAEFSLQRFSVRHGFSISVPVEMLKTGRYPRLPQDTAALLSVSTTVHGFSMLLGSSLLRSEIGSFSYFYMQIQGGSAGRLLATAHSGHLGSKIDQEI